ncbi:histidine phosphatase family protein [Candidatus Woesearchaeota archaeon]|nr:histidine phosphatase family protein [Candidatus Woesearchaeota archaeon]
MKLIIIRHGQTAENKKKITQGHLDTSLSNEGKEQIKKIANRLKHEKIDFAYSSDLRRAKHTAEAILKFHPETQLILTEELREQKKGIYEGKHGNILHENIMKTRKPYDQFKPQNGESMLEVKKRTIKLYNELIDKHLGKTILIVTHGGPVRCLLMTLHKEPEENYKKYIHGNTSMTILEISDDRKHNVRVFNCNKHLED